MSARIRTYMHTYIQTCIHTYRHACTHTRIHACIHPSMYIWCTHLTAFAPVSHYAHVYMYAIIHFTHIHLQIYMYSVGMDMYMRPCNHMHLYRLHVVLDLVPRGMMRDVSSIDTCCACRYCPESPARHKRSCNTAPGRTQAPCVKIEVLYWETRNPEQLHARTLKRLQLRATEFRTAKELRSPLHGSSAFDPEPETLGLGFRGLGV